MKVFAMKIEGIRPTQLFISEAKYQKCLELFAKNAVYSYDPIPIKKIGNDVFFTDGHTRALVLWQNGFEEIGVYHDPDEMDWIMYLVDLQWCKDNGIFAIKDLGSRIVTESEYREKWIERCDEKHTRLEKEPLSDLKVHFEENPEKKKSTCEEIMTSLPEWFGIQEIAEHHIKMARVLPVICASLYGKVVGFASLKVHFDLNCEIYAMGVFREFHHRGIGKTIIEALERYCRERGIRYLSVKTVAEGSKNQYYANTRAFYKACGFKGIEEFDSLWQEPCLYMLKEVTEN
jgi:ribosomal protein S18 acetylase RimI-like enzyme